MSGSDKVIAAGSTPGALNLILDSEFWNAGTQAGNRDGDSGAACSARK